MIELLRRDFVVAVGIEEAWERLAKVQLWPSWAKHIKEVTLHPPGPLTASSAGRFTLAGGIRSTFQMEEFEPPDRWRWVGSFLTVGVHYDHRFERIDDDSTRLIWVVEADGAGSSTIGRLFGWVYARNVDKAIPRLQAELAG